MLQWFQSIWFITVIALSGCLQELLAEENTQSQVMMQLFNASGSISFSTDHKAITDQPSHFYIRWMASSGASISFCTSTGGIWDWSGADQVSIHTEDGNGRETRVKLTMQNPAGWALLELDQGHVLPCESADHNDDSAGSLIYFRSDSLRKALVHDSKANDTLPLFPGGSDVRPGYRLTGISGISNNPGDEWKKPGGRPPLQEESENILSLELLPLLVMNEDKTSENTEEEPAQEHQITLTWGAMTYVFVLNGQQLAELGDDGVRSIQALVAAFRTNLGDGAARELSYLLLPEQIQVEAAELGDAVRNEYMQQVDSQLRRTLSQEKIAIEMTSKSSNGQMPGMHCCPLPRTGDQGLLAGHGQEGEPQDGDGGAEEQKPEKESGCSGTERTSGASGGEDRMPEVDIDKMYAILVGAIPAQWYQLGEVLGISFGKLESIHVDAATTSEKLHRVLVIAHDELLINYPIIVWFLAWNHVPAAKNLVRSLASELAGAPLAKLNKILTEKLLPEGYSFLNDDWTISSLGVYWLCKKQFSLMKEYTQGQIQDRMTRDSGSIEIALIRTVETWLTERPDIITPEMTEEIPRFHFLAIALQMGSPTLNSSFMRLSLKTFKPDFSNADAPLEKTRSIIKQQKLWLDFYTSLNPRRRSAGINFLDSVLQSFPTDSSQ